MIGTIIEALKSVIDLLKKGREDRKLGLEIDRLEREKREHQRLIQPATFEDVKAFDPKFNLIRCDKPRMAKYKPPIPTWVILLAVLLGGIILVLAVWLFIRA